MALHPNVNDANRYARQVVTGKIPACRLTRLACQRHLDDLQHAQQKRWPYRFDPDKAERACEFIQLMPHTKGRWAAQKQRLQLEAWQKFIIASIFGWVFKRTGFRRFLEVYIEVPRKNGKSELAAAIGNYMLCADGESGPEVYCGATTEKQAWKVFGPARRMAEMLPNLRKKFQINVWAQKLTTPDGGIFEPVIGDPGDGDSPSCSIIDEYHEHATDALYTTMITGMGAREQPLAFIITTSGYNRETPCYDKRQQVVETLDNIRRGREAERLFGVIYTIDDDDDWREPAALIKANPNYGVSVNGDYLQAQIQQAVSTPSQTNKIKTKHLNLWVSAKEAYFNMERWRACEDTSLTLEDFRGESAYLGIDMATKLDLTAAVPVFRREIDGKIHFYAISPRFWVPEETVLSTEPRHRRMAERYQNFVNQGFLTSTDGAEIDSREIFESILSLRETVGVEVSAIDPFGAVNISHWLAEEELNPVTIQQRFSTLSDPMRELEAAIAAGRFHHDGNPILTWCMSNVIGRYLPGSDDVIRPIKQGDENKIDGAVALIMGIGRAMLNVPDEDLSGFLNNPIIAGL
jgi:phage terminase large subunit-like protein